MPNGTNGVTIPKWLVSMLIPIATAIGIIFIMHERVKEIPRHEARIQLLERGAAVSGEDRMLLKRVERQQLEFQTEVVERLTRIETQIQEIKEHGKGSK